MFSRFTSVTFAAVLSLAAACGSGDAPGRGTWDVAAGPVSCSSTDTGAATNDDPGTPQLIELKAQGVARVTLDDGSVVQGLWYENAGDPSLPANAPGRQPQIGIDLADYEHAGASWSNLGLRLDTDDGDLRLVHGVWQAISTRTTTVTHSLCTSQLVATQR